jgi:hypothetical protein
MATVLAPGDILRATWDIPGLNGQTALPSVHYIINVVAGAPTDQQLADKLDLIITPNLLPCINALATYRNVIVQKIAPLPIYSRVFQNASTAAGTSGPNPVPQQVSGLIGWQTPVARRGGKGRFYMPFPATINVNTLTGHPQVLYLANLGAFAAGVNGITNFGTVPNTATCQQVIFERKTLGFAIVTGISVRALWATQKRRGDYGRVNAPPI